MKTINSFVFYTLLSWTLLCTISVAHAQRQNAVRRTPRHDEIRKMAKEIIHTKKRTGLAPICPTFRICNDGHLHWHIGSPDIWSESFAMNERLRIEWFWKHLSRHERNFWMPYTREIDAEIDRFIRISLATNGNAIRQQEQSRIRIDKVYLKAINAYALANGVRPKEEEPCESCASAEKKNVRLRTNARGVVAIKWIEAGAVWLAVSRTGKEPEYHSHVPGDSVDLFPGAMYYYKLVFRDGQKTKRLLAPIASYDSKKLLLAPH